MQANFSPKVNVLKVTATCAAAAVVSYAVVFWLAPWSMRMYDIVPKGDIVLAHAFEKGRATGVAFAGALAFFAIWHFIARHRARRFHWPLVVALLLALEWVADDLSIIRRCAAIIPGNEGWDLTDLSMTEHRIFWEVALISYLALCVINRFRDKLNTGSTPQTGFGVRPGPSEAGTESLPA